MKKILFVCLGNICRSPMAKFVFEGLLKKKGLESKYFVDSAGTSNEETGNDMHYGTKDKLDEKGVAYTKHKAKQMKKEDYEKYDYIIAMETSNIRGIMRIIGEDKKNKVCRLLDYTNNPRTIADPWYTGNFEITYNDIVEGCNALIHNLGN